MSAISKMMVKLKYLVDLEHGNKPDDPVTFRDLIYILSAGLDEEEVDVVRIKRFVPPSLEEATLYCLERKNNVDSERWWNFYKANGWKVGKNPMKDWRAAIRTWEQGRVASSNPATYHNEEGKL